MTNYKYGDCCKDHYPYPRPCPEVNHSILNCGNGTGLVIPQHAQADSQLINPYVIASVSIDTSELKRANIKIDFSCNILFREDDGDDLRLTFQLSKVYANGSAKIALGTWTFERDFDFGEEVETVDSFGFTWCECDVCPGCAYYIVELTNVESDGVDFAAITSPTINALAVGPLAHDHHDY